MNRALAGLIVLALVAVPLRQILAHPLRLSVLPSLQVDAPAYDAIAAEVARTRSLDPIPPLQPPGFVLTLASVYMLAGHTWLTAKVFLWLVFLVCVVLAARVGWRLYGTERHAWAAALLTAAAPAMHGYVGTVQYEVIAAAWLLVIVLLADRARNCHAGISALLGLSVAAATLTREVFVVVIPVVAIFLAHQQHRARGGRHAIVCALIVALCAIAPVAAWTTMQSGRQGRVVALSDKGPLVMAFGNNPRANGTFNTPLVGVGDPSGAAFIRAEPVRFMELAGRKFLYFWGVLRDGWNVPRPAALWLARAFGGAVPLEWLLPLARGGWLLAALVIAMAMWQRTMWQQWWVLPAAIAAILCVHLVTVASHRFAVPVLPIVFAILAAPAVRIGAWLVASRIRRTVSIVVLAVIFAMQGGEWPVRYSIDAADTDGLNAVNAIDPDVGPVRAADAARGQRPVLVLSDEALPAGSVDVVIRLKAAAGPSGALIAHAWLQDDAGSRICEAAITTSHALPGDWVDVTMPCTLTADTIATVVVETTGAVDLAFQSLRLRW